MRISRERIVKQPHARAGLCAAWLAAGLLFAQQAGAWPDLKIVKSGQAQAAPGDVITYTLNYTNNGPVKSTSVVMKDFLPANVTALTNTLNGGTLSGSTISWNIGTLNSKAKGSRTFQVQIGTNFPTGESTITNRSEIFGKEAEEDGDDADNYSKFITKIIKQNKTPVAQNDAYTTPEDTVLVISAPGILANDSDADGNALTAVIVGNPTQGTLTLNTNGGFTYRPNTNYNGVDSFTYRANDGKTNSGIATVTITVTPINDPPIARNDQYSTPEDTALTVSAPGVLSNDSDPDGNTLTAIIASQPGNGQVSLNSNGSFTYTPNLNFQGNDSFTYRANDGTANSGIATVTITVTAVDDPPMAQNDAYTVNQNSMLTILAPGVLANDSDPEGNALTAILVNAPTNGVLMLGANGSFTYAPNSNYHGADVFSYRANDGLTNSGIALVNITVLPANRPPLAQNDQYSTPEDTALIVSVPGVLANDSDPDGNVITAAIATQPANGLVTLNLNGSFTYTPTGNFAGVDTFTYRASDGLTNSGIATVTITVIGANDPPIARNDQYSTPEDTALVISALGVLTNDSDPDGDVLTAIIATSPANGQVVLNSNGGFTYMPTTNFSGVDSFTYRASDGTTNSGIATVTITVIGANDPPVAQDDQYSTLENITLVVTVPGVLTNDSDPDGDTLTASVVSLPVNGLLTPSANGSFTYAPNTNFIGADTFTYRANDGQTNSGIATVTIIVIDTRSGTNQPPIAQGDQYSTPEDTALVVSAPGVLTNDSDPDGNPLTAILSSNPAHGMVALNTNGSFSYLPNTNYSGIDSFTYRANDGLTNSSAATVTITLIPANDPPLSRDDAYSVGEDTPLVIAAPGVLTNDSDPDGDALTTILSSGPAHGTLALNTNGGFTYTPNTNFTGADSFTYRASDGITNSGIATVTITVTGTNDPPIAQNDQYTTTEDTSLITSAPGVLANDSDPDGDAITAIIVNSPGNGQLTLNNNGSFTYLPNTNYSGIDSFTYRASDGQANSGVATVTITVLPANDPPAARNDNYAVGEDTTLLIAAPGVLVNDTDPDGDTLTTIPASLPTHGTLTLNGNGGFTYVPNTNYNGVDSFTYRASDGITNSDIATVTITVTGTNDPPVALDDQYFMAANTVLTIGVPGVLTNDFDADGDSLTAVLVSSPTNGLLTLSSNGGFVYTPNTNFSGLDTFTYRASDGQAASAPATVIIQVNSLPPPPPPDTNNWSGKSFTLYEDTVLNVAPPGVLRGIIDAHGLLLKAVLLHAITNGTLGLNLDGGFNLTPRTNFNGVDAFSFAVSDDFSNSVALNVDITVIPVNDPPSFAKGGNFRLPQNAGPQISTNWATSISPGPADESGQLVTFQVANNNNALFSTQPTVSSNGTLTFTPATGASGLAIVTVIARDNGGTADGGVDTSVAQTFSINLNTPPTVQIVSPTNGASFFVPGNFTVLADALDVDGIVTNVQFFLGTNSLATVTSEPFFTVLTNLPVGSYTLGAVATDDFGATGTATPVTVNVLERPPLTYLTSVYYNPQKDFFEQRVRVSNPTYSTLNAVRVLVSNLTNTPPITVGNRTGITNGIPYVQSAGAIQPGSYVDLTIEYLSPLRIMPNPILRAELVAPVGPTQLLQGAFQHINRGVLLANRTFLVEFFTQSNRVYAVQYSQDLAHWKNAHPAIQGEGKWIQWIDNGEPKTDGSPGDQSARFYRLILLP